MLGRKKKTEVEEACSFCGRAATNARYLVKGPDDVNICNECVDLCAAIVKERASRKPNVAETIRLCEEVLPRDTAGAARSGEIASTSEAAKVLACSFCGSVHDEVEGLITAPDANICNRCVKLCTTLLKEGLGRRKGGRCIYLAPEGEPFAQVFRYCLEPLAEKLNLKVSMFQHAPNVADEASILGDKLDDGALALIDVTGKDPLVMFGFGLAYCREIETIVLARNREDVPLDWLPSGVRYFAYQSDDDQLKALAKALSPHLEDYSKRQGFSIPENS